VNPWWLVFDVESIGLHGVGFAVGAVVVNPEGRIVDEFYAACPIDRAASSIEMTAGPWNAEDLDWVRENVKLTHYTHDVPMEVAQAFWNFWARLMIDGEGRRKLYMAADVPWPVEANFLRRCVAQNWPESKFQGPYPLIDIASIRLAAGFDPLATEPRYASELPVHNPLSDAWQSARSLAEALARIQKWRHDGYTGHVAQSTPEVLGLQRAE
jgi:hypothetical protein